MSQFRELLRDRQYRKFTLFLVLTAALLYTIYFSLKNLDLVLNGVFGALSAVASSLTPFFIGLILAYLLSPPVGKIESALTRLLGKGGLFSGGGQEDASGREDGSALSDPDSQSGSLRQESPSEAGGSPRQENPSGTGGRTRLAARLRLASILIAYLIILIAVIILLYTFASLLIGQFTFRNIGAMASDIVDYVMKYEAGIREWASSFRSGTFSDALNRTLEQAVKWLSGHFSGASVLQRIQSVGGGLVKFFLGIMLSIYLLYDSDFFKGLWRRFIGLLFPRRTTLAIESVLSDVDEVFSLFIRGALLDALIVAVLSSIGLSLLGLKFSVFIGCFAGLCNVIPYFGPILGMIPAFAVGALTGSVTQGILAVVILFTIQQIDANLIYPKVVGGSTGLHPVFVLLAVTVAGYFGGLLWMVLAVPVAGLLQKWIIRWAKWRTAQLETESRTDSPEQSAPPDGSGSRP